MGRFEGKAAVITGGAQGIGEAITRKLADGGGMVAILDIQTEKAGVLADDIVAKGGKAIAVKMDIVDSQDVKRAVKEVEDKFGRIDILVNNAGWEKAAPFIELSEEIWDKIIAINLRGHMTVTRAVLDGMMDRRYGRIVNIGSDAGRVGSLGEAVYSACKGGIIALTKTLAREMVRHSILVNCVCPGPTDTAMMASVGEANPKLKEALQRAIPMRRFASPEDIASAVAFMASDEASFITGQTLSVNGGLTMS